MATLVSPGVSVTIVNESYYIPAQASTVPLIFIATRADKMQANGITPATGSLEHSVVRTITSLNQSVSTYGVPYFRTDNTGAQLHGDARNEYGLFALNQALTILNTAYVIRANVDLADSNVTVYSAQTPNYVGSGNGTLSAPVINQATATAELWTLTATATPTIFSVTGSITGATGQATLGVLFNNGKVSFTIGQGFNPFVQNDAFTFNVIGTIITNPLGANDAAKRLSILTALRAEIVGNADIRSEIYEYNLILCPGYYEVIGDLLNLNLSINEEAFVIADCPVQNSPENTAVWSMTNARQVSTNVAYYYPNAIATNLDGTLVFCAASGVALKTIAYSDSVSEIWYPPAGFRRGIVTGVTDIGYVTGTLGTATTFISTPLNQGQRDILYQAQANINIIPFFPGHGIVVFGQKTSAATTSALDRINVMRLMIMMKRDIRKASLSYLFELNDRITRDSIKQMIDNYLHDILIRRGLYDFVTICDATNNTPTRIDSNELWVDIAVKPVKSVEFIYVPIRVVSTGASL